MFYALGGKGRPPRGAPADAAPPKTHRCARSDLPDCAEPAGDASGAPPGGGGGGASFEGFGLSILIRCIVYAGLQRRVNCQRARSRACYMGR